MEDPTRKAGRWTTSLDFMSGGALPSSGRPSPFDPEDLCFSTNVSLHFFRGFGYNLSTKGTGSLCQKRRGNRDPTSPFTILVSFYLGNTLPLVLLSEGPRAILQSNRQIGWTRSLAPYLPGHSKNRCFLLCKKSLLLLD